MPSDRIQKTEQEWRAELSDQQYRVTRCSATEPAFTGEYWDNHDPGMYRCICCGEPLFTSETSFFEPVDKGSVELDVDRSYGMSRTEAKCKKCGAHLGHVFPDGPRPTGERYCINCPSVWKA